MSFLDLTPESGFDVSREEKNDQTEQGRSNLDKKDPASLELMQQSVAGLTSGINAALATFSQLSERGEVFVQRLPGSNDKEWFQEYFFKMRMEYGKVATLAESIAEVTGLIVDQLTGIVDNK